MEVSRRQERVWMRVRRGALLGTGVWCVGLGVGLGGALVGNKALASTNTAALMMIVGVIVLPACTLVAIVQDRRVARRRNELQLAESKVFGDRGSIVHERHDRATRHGSAMGRGESEAETTIEENTPASQGV